MTRAARDRLCAAVLWLIADPLAMILAGDRPTLLGLLVVVRCVAIGVAIHELRALPREPR